MRVTTGSRRRPDAPSPPPTTRYDIATVSDVWGAWDASDSTRRTPSNATLITGLTDRSGFGNNLTAAALGNNEVAVTLANPASLSTTGGNGMRRLDAADGVADNMFAFGGTLVAVIRAASPSGVLVAKWNNTGWILWANTTTTLRFEYYAGGSEGSYTFPFPSSATAWSLLEFTWNSDTANIDPIVRIDGTVVTHQGNVPGAASVDDSVATMVIGNRNWGGQNTPWSGDIGEIILLAGVPTDEQRYQIRADLMQHWGITVPTAARFNAATLPGLIGVWDASNAASRTPTNAALITALAPRSGTGPTLTAAAAGNGEVALALSDRSYLSTVGGNGMRRLDAPANAMNNIFASEGMLVAVIRSGNPSGIIAAKWNTDGWILWAPTPNTLAFEWYQGAQTGSYTFPFTASASNWSLIEIIWNSSLPNTVFLARVNEAVVTVTGTATGAAFVDDSSASLAIGNRNWGGQNTPWSGDIGEVMLFNSTALSLEQLNNLQADLMGHWNILSAVLPEIDLTQYTLTFDEDFNAPLSRRVPGDASTDGNLWATSMGNGLVRWMGSPPERQIYVEPEYAGTSGGPLGINPFSVADSVLTITCAPVSEANAPYLSGKLWTSGLITTQHSFGQLYGYFEMRAQLPAGMGTWPAFWLLFHNTGSSEFDIVETYGVNPSAVFQTVHQSSGSQSYESAVAWSSGWHTYGMLWTAEQIVYYIDRVPRAVHPNVTYTPGYLIANLALEGRADRAPDASTIFPLEMKIDYIRCWQPNS
jgi:hypothetical protein